MQYSMSYILDPARRSHLARGPEPRIFKEFSQLEQH